MVGAEGGDLPQTVSVRMYETYDLSTVQSRMGLIAIKTPSMPYIEKRYPGLIRQFKFVSLNSCDVVVSCASSLPADPLQIGTTAGKVAPQDMFNPLLYTAVSNDSWNGLIQRIYGGGAVFSSGSGTVKQFKDAFPSASYQESTDAYYALLAENKFKKAFVQSGLEMRGLRPLVYPVLTPNGMNVRLTGTSTPSVNDFNDVISINPDGRSVGFPGAQGAAGNVLMKGSAQPLPRLQTKTYAYNTSDGDVTNPVPSVMMGGIPPCYLACIVVPPATLNITYFRMTICWHATFSVLESDMEMGLIPTSSMIKPYVYYATNEAQQVLSAKELKDVSDTVVDADEGDIHRSVTADGVELQLVMEK